MVAHSCVAFADKSREQSRIREAGFVNRKFSLRTSIKGNYSSLLLDASSAKPFTLRPVTLHLSRCLKLASFKGPNLHGARNLDNGGRLNMGMRNIMEIFNGEGRRFDDSAQRSARMVAHSLMTPLLILLFGIHPATAVGTDLLHASATKAVAA